AAATGGPFVYTGEPFYPQIEVSDGLVAVTPADWVDSYGVNISAGAGTITLTGERNYTGVKVVTFTIEPRPLDGGEVTLDGSVFTETGSPITPGVVRVVADGITVPVDQYDVSYSDNVTPGEAKVTVTAKPGVNFTGSVSGVFTIEALPGPVTHQVVEPFGSWSGQGEATAVVEGSPTDLIGLVLDGVLVDPSVYTVTAGPAGSVSITLTNGYLASLPVGVYQFIAEFTDGVSGPISLSIQQSPGPGPSPSPSPSPAPSPKPSVGPGSDTDLPFSGTGGAGPLLWLAVTLLAAGLILARRARLARRTR
ncbi:MAG: hypothetical protein LBG11_05395, partial [Bifidobacteriaceae bacterium]|nr:hypothetical protein [Bifidobacteriaceae bacterium]